MAELKWLDGYSEESTDELLALEGAYRTDSIVLAFEQALNQKEARNGAECLTEEERVIVAVEALEREVNNGGYEQFFINSSKEYASIIVASLRSVECEETAALTQDSIDALGIHGLITVEAINRVMDIESDDRSKKLGECDKRYFKVAGDLSKPLLYFIKNNKNRVRLPG
jgi:hypothetical protein